MSQFHYRVPEPIVPVDQGRVPLCWLASTSVLFSWQAPAPVSMADAAARMGPEFVAKYGAGAELSYGEIPVWASRAGFRRERQQCIAPEGWNQLLRAHGPLVTVIDGTGSNAIDHVVVVIGIDGDGGARTTTLTLVNSQGGIVETRSLYDFVSIFELPAGQDELFSVMYLP